MNRDRIFEFIANFDTVYLCGAGSYLEAACWYFEKNKIAYSNIYSAENFLINKRGAYFVLEDAEDAEQFKKLINASGNPNLYCFSKSVLREAVCMKSNSSESDKEQAEALICAVEDGNLNTCVEKYNYAPLMYIKNFYPSAVYKKVFNAVCTYNKSEKDKKERIKIGFLIKHSSEWSADSIYHYLKQNECYELMVYIAPYWVGTKRSVIDNYHATIQYFEEKGYPYTEMYNENESSYIQWTKENTCDYMFNLTANFVYLRETSCVVNFPLSTLNLHIPYGYYISGFVESQFNQLSHMLFWKNFCESDLHKSMAGKYADLGNDNVEFSGYVKMDYFYEDHQNSAERIWSIPKGCKQENMKKIIYAPHWSIADSKTAYGNFEKNYKFLLEYAKQTKNEISWIIKPHPKLRSQCVVQGIFATEDEYDAYLNCWEQLENGHVVTSGTYEDVFETSDAMLLDSISFMAEYMYVHKPIILLTRKEQTTNDFGEKLIGTLYQVDGEDNEGIKKALNEIVICEKDEKKDEREAFFQKYLDYYHINGMSATEYIMQFIRR